ncbi:50S ribosomal protein L32 [Patescibacteria group bacterium]|nr:50S ribosomal protein L32 [Patescibacteria group bacterium]MCL5409953.1 50S ribosomal protein L32 [Patescibacteria group bacterium]
MRKRTRRASIMLKNMGLVLCTNCHEPTLSHQVCKSCGFYDQKQVNIKTEVKVTKA